MNQANKMLEEKTMAFITGNGTSGKMGKRISQTEMEEIKNLYSEAVSGNREFHGMRPGSYGYQEIMDGYQYGRLYRPLLVKFGLI